MIAALYLLFFLSGAAGLMYESVWTRYLGLFVGNQAYAQILVLVIFLGGMSLGAIMVSRRAGRVRDPLWSYAVMEVLIGILGLAFHWVFRHATGWAYSSGFPAVAGGPLLLALKWGMAIALILPQSILLGTTFPLMSAGVIRRAPREPGRVLGWLYFTNSIGAAIGVLVAGFVIVDLLGLPGVLKVAAALNIVVALGAFAVVRFGRGEAEAPVADAPVSPATPMSGDGLERLLLGAAFFTAIASFCYEVDWIRMLSLVLGSATRSFELMLSAFILGLALGAYWIRRRGDRFRDGFLALGTIQVVMGLLAVATLPLYIASFGWMATLLNGVAKNGQGFSLFTIAEYGLCLLVMLPATFCAGMTLPLITRALLARGNDEGAIGRVYAVNTLGSIVGAGLAGLFLLPLLGLKGLILLGGGVDIMVGLVLLRRSGRRTWVPELSVFAALALLVVGFTSHFDRALLTRGVFRGRQLDHLNQLQVPFYADGRTATVSVTREADGHLAIATNGKADASLTPASQRPCDLKIPPRSIAGDEVTQILLGAIPLAYLPHGGNVAVIGMGSGTSTHTLLSSPKITSATTIEMEPRMADGARMFLPFNKRTFEDPRSHIVLDDAKAWFAASPQKWDAIMSEPSNPWVRGVSGLFTVEFYQRIRSHLAQGGIFAQWVQAYELDDDLLLSVLSALSAVFPDWRVHEVGGTDFLLIASGDAQLPTPDWSGVAGLPALREQLCGVFPLSAEELEASLVADRTLLAPVVDHLIRPNSDFHPLLDLGAERSRFELRTAEGMLALSDSWFNLARELTGVRQLPVEALSYTFSEQHRRWTQFAQTWQTREALPDTMFASDIAATRFDWNQLNSGIALDKAPVDWRPWMVEFTRIARIRHLGTAGWVDSALYARAEAFAVRHGAPKTVLSALAFRRGIQSWDVITTLRAGAELEDPQTISDGWVSADELRDATVVAALRMGNPDLAKRWYDALASAVRRNPLDARALLLYAWLMDARARAAKGGR